MDKKCLNCCHWRKHKCTCGKSPWYNHMPPIDTICWWYNKWPRGYMFYMWIDNLKLINILLNRAKKKQLKEETFL